MKIIALGDSVTFGPRRFMRESNNWVSILERILDSWLDEKVEIINAGVGGDTSKRGLERLERDVISHNPDYTLIMFGLNDMFKISFNEYKESMEKIVLKLKEKNIVPILMTSNPFTPVESFLKRKGIKDFDKFEEEFREYISYVRELAERENVLLIDIYKFFKENPVLLLHICDGVHPDMICQPFMASFIAEKLFKLLGIKDYPHIALKRFKKVFSDGYHNAFTDLIKWRNKYYLCFRHGTRHFIRDKPDGEIYVLESEDIDTWNLVKVLKVEGWDNRDPKFFIYNDKLYLYTQSWSPERKIHETFCFYTEDLVKWYGPYDCGQYIFWRPRIYRDKIIVAAYTHDESEWKVDLLTSKDGIKWKYTTTMFRGRKVNETDLLIEEDRVKAFSRTETGNRKLLLLSPVKNFKEWKAMELSRIIQGPAVIKFKGDIYVLGRFYTVEEDWEKNIREKPLLDFARTGCFILKDKELRLISEFPSGGDCSYPGVIKLDTDGILVSYYSGHEDQENDGRIHTNIYLMELEIK